MNIIGIYWVCFLRASWPAFERHIIFTIVLDVTFRIILENIDILINEEAQQDMDLVPESNTLLRRFEIEEYTRYNISLSSCFAGYVTCLKGN